MKLLTLNCHSLVEENYGKKLDIFAKAVKKLKPDIIALQEVNQRADSPPASEKELSCFFETESDVEIKASNHMLKLSQRLDELGEGYFCACVMMKKSYGFLEEGVGILSRFPIIEARQLTVSKTDDSNNWKRRKILGVRTELIPDSWFYSVHFSWWNDCEEPFVHQWEKALWELKNKKVWLLGDFNAPHDVSGEAYDMIKISGFHDLYDNAIKKDSGFTVAEEIDGWKGNRDKKRIDYIFTNETVAAKKVEVVFDGNNFSIVSDHFGVFGEI